MQLRPRLFQLLLVLFTSCTLCSNTSEAQCPISYKNPPQGTINLVLGGNCAATFDATTYLNILGNCTLLYFKDAGMTMPYIGLPGFNASAIGQNIEIYVTADDGNPGTPPPSPLKFNLNIIDTTAPVLNCPTDQVFNSVAGACAFTVNSPLLATAVDNCSASTVSWTLSGATNGSGSGPLTGIVLNVGKNTLSYLATDASGNGRTCSTLLDVRENIAPTIVSCPSNASFNATANTCQFQINSGLSPVFSDNCTAQGLLALEYALSGATVANGNGSANNAFFNVGQTVVRYRVRDDSGNENTSCSFTITINDTEKPLIICPANITINTLPDSTYNYIPISNVTPFSADNCGQNNLSLSYQLSGATQTVEAPLRGISQQRFNFGVSLLTLTVKDASGNSSSCVQQINIVDQTAPKINCNNSDISTNASSGECAKVLQLNAPTYTDNITATNLLVLDYACTGAVNSTGNGAIPAGFPFNAGLTKVTYRVRDGQNNSAQCSFDIFVNEGSTIKPSIKCPKDITAAAQIGLCSAKISAGLAPDSLADNCTPKGEIRLKAVLSGATMVNDTLVSPFNGVNGFTFNIGETIITYTATDGSGNSESSSFKLTITDRERPVISCAKDLTVTLNNGCSGRVSGLQATATDNCNPGNLTFSYKITGATAIPGRTNSLDQIDFYTGKTRIDCYVEDAAQNQDSCHFFLTVLEKINPTINCPSDTILNTPFTSCMGFAANIKNPVFSDDCSLNSDLRLSFTTTGATSISGPNTIRNRAFNLGISKVTYTITDFSGNNASCTFDIKVVDVIRPVISCPPNTTINNLDTTCFALVNSPAVVFSDNCSSTVSYVISGATSKSGNGVFSNERLNLGSNIVRYTVTDIASNTSTCRFELFVKDNYKPEILCPGNVNLQATANCTAILNAAAPLVRDNCSSVDLRYTVSGNTTIPNGTGVISGANFQLGLSTVTYIASDSHGNSSVCSFEVSVADKIAPTALCRPDITIALDNTGNAYLPSVLLDNGSFDNCTMSQQINFTSTNERFNCSHLGLNTIQLSVKDADGNENTCSSKVTVINSFNNLFLNASTISTDESYWGAKDGRTEAKVNGGTGNLSYSWNTGSSTANLQNIGAGAYTVTVTDNVSRCSTTATAVLNEGPKLTITVGNIISTKGSIVNVPVRVQNFNKIKYLRFSLDLQNSLVGSIIGIENFAVNMNDSGSYTISATEVRFSKFFRENDGVTLANGTAIFQLKIRLDGSPGTYSAIAFANNPAAPTATQILPAGLTTIPMNLIAGSVGINNGNTIARFGGTIRREDGITIRDARVSLGGTRADTVTTPKEGNYSFSLTLGSRAIIRPAKIDNPRTGLTAVDALLLQRHILGYQSLNSNYKKIAADVNRSGNLTALDVSEIKRVILGYQPTFRNTAVWRFVPTGYVFPNMNQNQVLGFPDSLSNNYVLNNQDSMDFVAIKTGDINLSANVANGRNAQYATLNVDDRTVQKNEIFEVQITASEKMNLAAIQAGIKIKSSDLRLVEVSSALRNFNVDTDCKYDQSELKMAWIDAGAQEVQVKESIMTLRLKALKDLNSLEQSLWLDDENYSNLLADETVEKSIMLAFKKAGKQPMEEVETVIFPNPASEILNINHPELEAIVLTDINGKVLLRETFSKPVASAMIQVNDIPSGSCFVSLISKNAITTRQIIIVH